MVRVIAVAGVLVGTLFAALLGLRPPGVEGKVVAAENPQEQTTFRLGVFESRAIAIAYAPSRFNTAPKKLMEEQKKAESEGNSKRIEELKKEGARLQDRLHRQGFGNAPVNDLLEHIKGSFPDACKAAGVEAIVTGVVFKNPGVETVDVTDLLVKPFEPSAKTLKHIEEIKKHPPLDENAFPLKH